MNNWISYNKRTTLMRTSHQVRGKLPTYHVIKIFKLNIKITTYKKL